MAKTKTGELIVKDKNKNEIASLDLFLGENIIGRISGEQIAQDTLLQDRFLSREHFIVDVEKDSYDRTRFFLRDNRSSNGTWLKHHKNGTVRKLEEKDSLELSGEDTILGGETYFVLKIDALPTDSRKDQKTRIVT